MTWPKAIIGGVIVVFALLNALWMHHWREALAWAFALGTWYMTALQESRISDSDRKIAELEKRLGVR